MRIAVTGAAGFVGRRLVAALSAEHAVVAIDRDCGALENCERIAGDLTDAALLRDVLPQCDALVHLATVPGGAAEADPEAAWRLNVDATGRLFHAACRRGMRIVFASTIATLGSTLPDRVSDSTVMRPLLLYGAHKLMMEHWLATLTRRGELDGVSLRLPGIVARPAADAGLRSAFLSDVFHAAVTDLPFTMPVSADATSWLMSIDVAVRNVRHAVERSASSEEPHVFTLPPLRTRMAALVHELRRQTGWQRAVAYAPDPDLEEAFARHPAISARQAAAHGSVADASLRQLVAAALQSIEDH